MNSIALPTFNDVLSAATLAGESACRMAIVARLSSGVTASTADTREACQCASASAKAPYAPMVLSAQ